MKPVESVEPAPVRLAQVASDVMSYRLYGLGHVGQTGSSRGPTLCLLCVTITISAPLPL